MPIRLKMTAVAGCLLALGCADRAGANQEAGNQAEPIYQISAEDAEMNAAMARGRATLQEFYARLASPAADETEFIIKFDIAPGDDVEYVWASDLDRSTSPMTGVLTNQPEQTTHEIGDRVPIPEADIVDWMFRRGRVMQGGFTARVLLKHMTPEDAASQRAYFGW
jgi:uncharacterized protein YegJ (DUF2314 family)